VERIFKDGKHIIPNILAQHQDDAKNKQYLLKQSTYLTPTAGHFDLKRLEFHSECSGIAW